MYALGTDDPYSTYMKVQCIGKSQSDKFETVVVMFSVININTNKFTSAAK